MHVSVMFMPQLNASYQPCKIASAFGCADAKAEAISICVGNFIADAKPHKHLCRQHVNTVNHCFHT